MRSLGEAPSKEKAVLCFCGYRETFRQNLEGGGEMDFEKVGRGRVFDFHSSATRDERSREC